MGFFKFKKITKQKKFPLFFTYKKVCKTLPNVTTLYPKTCVTDIKVAEFNTPSDGDGAYHH